MARCDFVSALCPKNRPARRKSSMLHQYSKEVRMDGPYSTAQLRAPNFGDPAQRHLGCFTSGHAAMWKCI